MEFTQQRSCPPLLAVGMLMMLLHVCSADEAPTFRQLRSSDDTDVQAQVTHIVPDGFGHLYAAGSFSSPTLTFGTQVLTNNGTFQSFVVKFDAEFNPQWARTSPFVRRLTFPSGLGADTNGNCYFASTGQDPGDLSALVKYNADGEPLWTNRMINVWANANALGLDEMNNCYFTGTTNDTNFLLVKINPQGTRLWSSLGGAIGPLNGHAIAVDRNGNSIVATSLITDKTSFGGMTLTNRGHRDILIVRHDAGGNLLSAGHPGGSGDDVGTDVVMDAAGDSYFTGWISSTNAVFGKIDYERSTNFAGTIYISKLDPEGRVVWAKEILQTAYNYPPLLISLDQHTNLYITGWVDIGGFVRHERLSFYAEGAVGFVIKCNSEGEALWAKPLLGGRGNRFTSRIAIRSPFELYVGGEFDNWLAQSDPFIWPTDRSGLFIATLGYNPRLRTSRAENLLALSWPTNEPGFILETTRSLAEPNWSIVTNIPVIQGSEHHVTNALSDSAQFFRLRK